MNYTSIVGNWYVSNAARTLATNYVSKYSSAFFLATRVGTAYRHLFYVAGTDAEMRKSFNLKEKIIESSTVAQIAERFKPNTVLWAFHTIQPSSLCLQAHQYYMLSEILDVHRESKKGCHSNHGYNFVNSWWICKILSLLERPVNFQQNQ